jgi:hypothetical protein
MQVRRSPLQQQQQHSNTSTVDKAHIDDMKILFNDWPYGIDSRIVHLVIWVKFPLEEDTTTGDLTDTARQQINSYVDTTFASKVGSENCIWFKNWASLKSIQAVEHFHVMLFDPDIEFVQKVTLNDVPLVDKIQGHNLTRRLL